MSQEREVIFFMARVADQAERHLDVIKFINSIIAIDPKLTADERSLLSVAYKAITGSRRTALRSVLAFLEDPSIHGATEREASLNNLKKTLLEELDQYCNDIIQLVDNKLLPAASDEVTKVFYEKLKADYYRYSVEFRSGDVREKGAELANKCYKTAMDFAATLSKANPQFLGLALNYSVFLYEIIGQKSQAIELADKSFKEAVDLIDKLEEDEYSEATLILQLLKDNVQLWNEEQL